MIRPAGHEHLLDASLASINHAPLHMGRTFGEGLPDEGLPDEGGITCLFDDSWLLSYWYASVSLSMNLSSCYRSLTQQL